jgi:hypothetical protein
MKLIYISSFLHIKKIIYLVNNNKNIILVTGNYCCYKGLKKLNYNIVYYHSKKQIFQLFCFFIKNKIKNIYYFHEIDYPYVDLLLSSLFFIHKYYSPTSILNGYEKRNHLLLSLIFDCYENTFYESYHYKLKKKFRFNETELLINTGVLDYPVYSKHECIVLLDLVDSQSTIFWKEFLSKLKFCGVDFRTKLHPLTKYRPKIKEDLIPEIPYQMFSSKVTIGICSTALFENNSSVSFSVANLYPNKNGQILFNQTVSNYGPNKIIKLNKVDAFGKIIEAINSNKSNIDF